MTDEVVEVGHGAFEIVYSHVGMQKYVPTLEVWPFVVLSHDPLHFRESLLSAVQVRPSGVQIDPCPEGSFLIAILGNRFLLVRQRLAVPPEVSKSRIL